MDKKQNKVGFLEFDHEVGALIFANALGFLLKENEGIAIVPKNDMLKFVSPDTKTLFIFRKNSKIRINSSDEIHEDGQMFWMHDEKEIES